MKGIRFFLLFLSIFSVQKLAAKDYGTYYFSVAAGKSTNNASLDTEDIDFGNDPRLRFDGGSAGYLTLGKRFGKYLSLELKYADLGETGFRYGDFFDVGRETKLALLGLRVSISWFHFGLGIGYAQSKTNLVDLNSSGSYTTKIEDEDESYRAGTFFIGVNYPVTPGFIVFVETNAFAWLQDDGSVDYSVGADSGTDGLEEVQNFNLVAAGFRIYL